MKNKKTAIFLLVAVFILIPIGLTVFGFRMYVGTSKEIEQPVIYDRHYVMITGNEDSGLWDSVYESAREEGKKRGVCVERFGSGLAVEYDRNQLLKMAVQASVDGIIIVTSPQDLVSMIVGKAVKMAKMMNIPILGVIENYSYLSCPDCGKKIHLFGEGKTAEAAKRHNVPLLAEMPIDPALAALTDAGDIESFQGAWLDGAADKLENK